MSTYSNIKIINSSSQTPAIYTLKKEIERIKPDNKDIYSYRGSYEVSLPLFYLWWREGKIQEQSEKIGICKYSIERDVNIFNYIINCPDNGDLLISLDKYKVFNLNNRADLGEFDHLTAEKIFSWIDRKR